MLAHFSLSFTFQKFKAQSPQLWFSGGDPTWLAKNMP
jgi:hypothetical protein